MATNHKPEREGSGTFSVTLNEYAPLVQAVLDGNATAFDALYYKSVDSLEKVVRGVCKNPSDADDALQEAYIKIYNNLSKLSDPAKFLPWAKQIARNSALDLLRSKDSHTRLEDLRPMFSEDTGDGGVKGLDASDIPTDESDLSEIQYERDEVAEELRAILDSLPEEQKTALLMHNAGYKYQDIADELGMSLGTVKSMINRARKRVAKEVDRVEQERGIKLHAVSFLPVAGGFTVHYDTGRLARIREALDQGGLNGPSAQPVSATSGESIPLSEAHGAGLRTTTRVSLGKRIAIAVTAVLVVGAAALGVYVMVDNGRNSEDVNLPSMVTTSVPAGQNSSTAENTSAQEQSTTAPLQTTEAQNRQTTNTPAGTTARQTTAVRTTTARTTAGTTAGGERTFAEDFEADDRDA